MSIDHSQANGGITLDGLPNELIDRILRFLSPLALSRIARCCRLLYQLVLPVLYATIRLEFHQGFRNPYPPPPIIHAFLSSEQNLLAWVRKIKVLYAYKISQGPTPTKLHYVETQVRFLLKLCPGPIQGFKWVERIVPFPFFLFRELKRLHSRTLVSLDLYFTDEAVTGTYQETKGGSCYFPSLRKLKVSGNIGGSIWPLVETGLLIKGSPHLERLDLDISETTFSEDEPPILGLSKQKECLDYGVDTAQQAIQRYLIGPTERLRLKELALSYLPLNMVDLADKLVSQSELESLTLRRCWNSDGFLRCIKTDKLKSCSLHFYYKEKEIHDWLLKRLKPGLASLSYTLENDPGTSYLFNLYGLPFSRHALDPLSDRLEVLNIIVIQRILDDPDQHFLQYPGSGIESEVGFARQNPEFAYFKSLRSVRETTLSIPLLLPKIFKSFGYQPWPSEVAKVSYPAEILERISDLKNLKILRIIACEKWVQDTIDDCFGRANSKVSPLVGTETRKFEVLKECIEDLVAAYGTSYAASYLEAPRLKWVLLGFPWARQTCFKVEWTPIEMDIDGEMATKWIPTTTHVGNQPRAILRG